MATSADYMNFVMTQLASANGLSQRRMFGEYVVYCDARPVFLVCDNTVFAKQLPAVAQFFAASDKRPDIGIPYPGAKPHFVVDIDDQDFASRLATLLAGLLPLPKARSRKKQVA